MNKLGLIYVFITIVVALIILLVVDSRYVKKDIYQFSSTALTVDDVRVRSGLYFGHNVRVIGVLYPLFDGDVAVNAVLIPNKDFLEFSRTFLDSFFVRLGDIMVPEGGVAIKEECFGEYVSVTGTMSSFSGLPSLEPVVFIQDFLVERN